MPPSDERVVRGEIWTLWRSELTNPDLGLRQPRPVGREEELQASHGSLQGQCFNTEDGEDDVGEDSTEPEDLRDTEINIQLEEHCSNLLR